MIKSFEPTLTTKDAYKIYQLILSGDIGFGSNVKEFEDKFSEYSNKKYNIGLNSASSAAYCLFAYLYDKYGSCNVYTPSLGFTSVSWAAEKMVIVLSLLMLMITYYLTLILIKVYEKILM